MMHAVIMAGGAGTRFWPASRANVPKQLLDLTGDGTMLQATVRRLEGLCAPEQVLVVTNQRLAPAMIQQLPELPPSAVIGEPCKRDTAPCIGWSAALIHRADPEAVMVVMPADHVIGPREAFQDAIRHAVQLVEQQPQKMVTFGIRPTYPAQTFGYIERGEPIDGAGPLQAARVERFREKPDADTARQYLETGRFYWNSGIFVWKAATVLQALERFEPQMMKHLQAIVQAADTPDASQVLQREFEAIDGKSIDYAVMEHYEDVCVIEAPFEWDDLGSWRAMARLLGEDQQGNTFVGRHLAIDTQGSIVRSDNQHLVVTLGMRDCIVVHTPDATLVANKNDEEAIRDVVKRLKELGWEEYL